MTWDADIVFEVDVPPDFNCACADDADLETLASLRTTLMRRLGFSAQVANPPPGMTELLDSFLDDAQKQLYRRYAALRTERFYYWTMTPGLRFYGIGDNEDDCAKRLDPHKVTWVGVQDLNDAWYPLIEGIPPELYTRAQTSPGWPTRYEIRSCIEVFPAPQDAYKLWIKGHFGLQSFTEDADTTTIDSHPVFLVALGNAKNHYGQRDGGNYLKQAESYIGSLVSGSHHTARYVPGPRLSRVAATPPRMVSFDDE